MKNPSRLKRVVLIAGVLVLGLAGATSAWIIPVFRAREKFSTGKLSFAVKFKDEVNPYRVLAFTAMPQSEIKFEIASPRARRFEAKAAGGTLTQVSPSSWRWNAPEQYGLYPITILEVQTHQLMTLNGFVLAPYDGSKTFHGYEIGTYRKEPLRGDPAYAMPVGFIEVTEDNADTLVSPHFKLRQFWCKQSDGYPKFLLLRERLLLKLESMLEYFNDHGFRADTLFVMSAFRTPRYNAAIGNKTTYSRHSYGDAADIFIDHDKDGVIDDLNSDGKIDFADGQVLENLIDGMMRQPSNIKFQGGLHLYPANAAHGPMVHVDTRGKNVRW